MTKQIFRCGFLLGVLLLIIGVIPHTFGGASNVRKSADLRPGFHALKPLDSESFRELDWLEQKVTADDGAAQDNLGWSVAIDGNSAVVGAPNATVNGHSSQGAAYVFSYLNGSWSQVAKLTASDGAAFDTFGYSVAISGNTAVIGAWHAAINGNPLQGAAYVFTYASGQWTEQAKLTADDGVAFDDLGYAVGL